MPDIDLSVIGKQKSNYPIISEPRVLGTSESQYYDGFIIPEYNPEDALSEYKAENQPGIDQLVNGVVKGAGLAATTFADTFGGTVFGIGNMIAKGASGDIESGGDLLNAFVNNPFSNAMQDINEGMESAFANYRTKAEQEGGLLDQMFDADKAANFWGDMFIKNLGFAGGAMAAGMVSGKLFSQLGRSFTQKKEVELFNKMTKSIATGEAKNIDEAIALLQQAPELTNTAAATVKGMLESGAKTYRNWNRANQITSSAIAATGEARIEALGNGRQFYESNKNTLDQEYIDPTTGQVKEGKELEYENKLKSLDENVKGFQNAEFLWNSVLLTASNFAGYRDMFAKNYALNAKRFEDSIKMTALNELKAGENIANAIKPKWYSTLGKSLMSSNREGMEEFFQGVVQKSAEDYYSGKFKGAKEGGITDIINSVGEGLSNSTNQEGLTNYFLGAFTGLIMPGAGLYQSFKDANTENVEAQERADNINKAFNEYSAELKQDPTRTIINFQEMLNRSANLDQAQQQALLSSDKYNYESLKHEKFYNLANAYIKAGKYEELSDMLKDETRLSVDDIRNKYTIPVDPKDETKGKKSFFDSKWSDDDVMTYIRKQSSTNLKAVEDLKNVTEDLEAMFGEQIALVSDGDKTKQVAIKDILNRSLYLGKTQDKRIVDLHTELSKAITDSINNYTLDTGDGFAITNFMAELPSTKEEFNKEAYDKVVKNFKKIMAKSVDPKGMQEKFVDYVQLVEERKAMNSAWIRLTNNNFTQTLNIIAKADKEAVETKAAEEAKQLSDDEKINIVRENSKRAGWVDKEGNGVIGSQFVIKVKGKNRVYELVPVNLTELRKEYQDERDAALEGLDPITDKEKIAEIIQKYNDKLQSIVEEKKTEGLYIRDVQTGEYVKNSKGQFKKFNTEFVTKNFDKINFVNKQQTLINKVRSTTIKSNTLKIEALEKVILSINKEIQEKADEAKKILGEEHKLKEELQNQRELFETLTQEENLKAVYSNIQALESRLAKLEEAKVLIKESYSILAKHKSNLLTLVKEVTDNLNKDLNFSFDTYINSYQKKITNKDLEQFNLDSVDNLYLKKIITDLQELQNTSIIDLSLEELTVIEDKINAEIKALTQQLLYLQEVRDNSADYKNWVIASKNKDLPVYFKKKWKVIPSDNPLQLLNDPKKLSRFKYIIGQYAKNNNISIRDAFSELRKDLESINLSMDYLERENIDTHVLMTSQDIETLKTLLAITKNVIANVDNRSIMNTINQYLLDIKLEYSSIINRDRKNDISNLPDSQKAGDEEFNPKPIHTNIAGRTLNNNALSDHLFYTTNMTVKYITNAEGKLETVYDADGYPVVNTNKDSIRWNNFLEQNTPDITNSKYVLRTYLLSGAKIPADLKRDALQRISDGGSTHNPANDIVTVLVNTADGEFVKSDDQGEVSKTGNYVYTFLPLADRLIENKGKSKVNLNALVNFFMRNSSMEVKDPTNIHLTDPTKYITVGDKQLTPSQFKDLVTDFAKANYNEFIAELKANMEANETTYLKAPGVTNGILLTRKSDKDVAKSPMSSVAEVLKNKRGLDSQNPEGLENIGVYVIDNSEVWEIPGSGIKIKNGKKGAVIVYNKETKEYFYANQRKLSTEDKKLIIYYLQQSRVQTESSLSEKKLNVGNDGKSYYMAENKGNNVKVTDVPIFGKPGTLSLMNNIIFWGGSKNPGSKNTIYLKSNKVYFSNPNQGWAITAIDLANLDNPKYNLDFMAFLDTKRHNISKNMFATNKFYKHPYINGKGELAWKTYQGGYKDFLLNSKDPILITNAVNSNSNYNGNKMLFASKNVILDSSNNGKPKILNKLQAEPVQTPKVATKPAAAPSAKPVATPVKVKVESINTDISIVSVTHDENINILSIKVKNNQSNNLTDFSIDADSGEIKIYRFNPTTQAYETLNLGGAKPLDVLASVLKPDLIKEVIAYQENNNKDLKSFLNLFGIAESVSTPTTSFNVANGEGLEGLEVVTFNVSDIEANKVAIERRRQNDLIEGENINWGVFSKDEINAKYDAELARELYKEMKAGKMLTEMTPAEQKVADKYITKELRDSVDSELAALSVEADESDKEVSSNQEVDKDKTVEEVAKEITECTGVVPSSTVMNGEELTELSVTKKPSATPEGNSNKFNGQGRNKKK